MRRRVAVLVLAVVAAGVVLGLVFAGSPTRIAEGVRIDGIDVGGLEISQARALLEGKAAALSARPVVFTAGPRRFPIRPAELGVESDWRAAVDSAQRQGSGFAPIRGFKRLGVDVFGADVTPSTSVLTGALHYELDRIAAAVDRPARNASLRLEGTRVVLVPAQPGRTLDRSAAATLVVHRLAALDRPSSPVQLPMRVTLPRVRALTLRRAGLQARLALSAPVHLVVGPTRFLLTPKRLAPLLLLPSDGRSSLAIGGAAADDWLHRLGARVDKKPVDATFAVDGPKVRLVPDKPGVSLDAVGSADAVLAAALHRLPARRVARLPVESTEAALTQATARGMGIDGLVSTF